MELVIWYALNKRTKISCELIDHLIIPILSTNKTWHRQPNFQKYQCYTERRGNGYFCGLLITSGQVA